MTARELEAESQPPTRSWARRVGGILAGLLVVGFLVWSVAGGWSRVSDYDWSLQPGLLALGIAALLVFYLATGLLYVSIVERLGVGHRVSRAAVLTTWAKSLLGRYVPGNVLMVTGRVVLGREVGVPARVSLAASVYEQTLLLTTAAIASIGFLAGYEGPRGVPWAVLALGVVLGLVLVHPRVFRPLSSWLLVKLKREPLREFLSERQLAALFVWYGAANSLLGIAVWLLVRSSAGPEAGDLGYVGLAFLLSFVLGMLAFVFPSGLGVREASFALVLGRNLPGGVAVAVAAGVRLVVTAVELVFVALVVGLARLAEPRSAGSGDRHVGR